MRVTDVSLLGRLDADAILKNAAAAELRLGALDRRCYYRRVGASQPQFSAAYRVRVISRRRSSRGCLGRSRAGRQLPVDAALRRRSRNALTRLPSSSALRVKPPCSSSLTALSKELSPRPIHCGGTLAPLFSLCAQMQVEIAMLSGDHVEVAATIAATLGIGTVVGGVLPGGKLEQIKQWQTGKRWQARACRDGRRRRQRRRRSGAGRCRHRHGESDRYRRASG